MCGKHNKKNKKAGKGGGKGSSPSRQGGRSRVGGSNCRIVYFNQPETQYRRSCSNNFKSECQTAFTSVCSNVNQAAQSMKCVTEKSGLVPGQVCKEEIVKGTCSYGGSTQACSIEKSSGRVCRIEQVQTTVEKCSPVASSQPSKQCAQQPSTECNQKPVKSCNQIPVTVNKRVARRVCQ